MLVLSFQLIVAVFLGSTFTAYTVCNLLGQSFYKTIKQDVVVAGGVAFVESVTITNYLLGADKITLYAHSPYKTGVNMFLYSLYIEFMYYVIHRLYHTRYCYAIIHKKHHSSYDIYPMDAFYFSIFDLNSMIVTFMAPTFLMHLNIYEFGFALYLYLTFAYISHSNILYQHHMIHHKYCRYNYCMLLPYFDVLFGTYQ